MSTPEPAPSRRESLRELFYLFGFLRPYRTRFLWAAGASMTSMSVGMLFPFLLGRMIDAAITTPAGLAHVTWNPGINILALLLVGTLVLQAPLTCFASLSFNTVGEKAVVDIRTQLFRRLVGLPMRFFGERRVGELTSRLSSDLAQIQEMFAVIVPQSVRQIILFLCGTAAITITSWRLSLVMVASLPPVIIALILFGRRVRKASREAQDRLAETATIVEETLQNIGSVKAYANEPYEGGRYAASAFLDRFLAAVIPTARLRAVLSSPSLSSASSARLRSSCGMARDSCSRAS